MNAESTSFGITNNARMPIKPLLYNIALEALASTIKRKKYDYISTYKEWEGRKKAIIICR